jgi:curli biogenesis system outer membrane secretion channel CsgG
MSEDYKFSMTYEELCAAFTEAHWTLVTAIEKSDEWTILTARENFQKLREEKEARKIEGTTHFKGDDTLWQ